jgi:hypothetical protein
MAGGRARAAAFCVLVAAALAVAVTASGCGTSSHANDPRPSPPTRVSVTINPGGLIVQPRKIAFGPEKTQQIPQNQNHAQPPIKTRKPLVVVFVVANQTGRETNVRLHGTKEEDFGRVLSRSPETFQTELPTGSYTLTADGIPASDQLAVGPYRASSQNDVLLP